MPASRLRVAFTSEEAEKAARKAIREQKKERKETLQQRVDALKAKFRKQ